LNAETQNLEIVVVPQVNVSAASLAYAALVNPALGLTGFFGNFLLNKPLSAAFTRSYSVTGPWSNPQIKGIRTQSAEPATIPGSATSASAVGPKSPAQ
jgi:uncharacterized protein YhdP